MEIVHPKYHTDTFHCPHCRVYAMHSWRVVQERQRTLEYTGAIEKSPFEVSISRCINCSQVTLWVAEKMVYPQLLSFESPNEDLPDVIKREYGEADAIASRSPRGACALLRLCVEKLVNAAGATGSTLDAKIASLVKNGLPAHVQKVLDATRVIGADHVHAGALDVQDSIQTAVEIADAINVIAHYMITGPKKAEALYSKLPQSKQDHVRERDGKGESQEKGQE